jgi:hypothetical protein
MPEGIKKCDYKDIRDIGMRWVCRCCDCRELFLGIRADFICGDCSKKPEVNKGGE